MKNVIKAIMAQSELTAINLSDVARHGADGGVSGFTYYTETGAFFDANESLINEILEQTKDACYGEGVSMVEMLQGFGRGSDLTYLNSTVEYDEDLEDYNFEEEPTFESEAVHLVLDIDNGEWKAIAKDTQYKNLMAWFLLEEGAQHIEQLIDEQDWETIESYGIDCTEAKEGVA